MKTYRKDILGNHVHVNGSIIRWEPVGASTGVRTFDETTDAATIKVLDELADQKRKGVRRISPEQYESLKKNFKPGARQNPLERIRVHKGEQVLSQPSKKPSASLAVPPVVVGSKPIHASETATPGHPAPAPDLPPNVIDTAADLRPKVKPRTMKRSELKAKEAAVDALNQPSATQDLSRHPSTIGTK